MPGTETGPQEAHGVTERLTRVEDRLDSHEERLDKMDLALIGLRQDIKNTENMLLGRMDGIEHGIGGKVDTLRESMNSQLAAMNQKYYETLQTANNSVPRDFAARFTAVISAFVGLIVGAVGLFIGLKF